MATQRDFLFTSFTLLGVFSFFLLSPYLKDGGYSEVVSKGVKTLDDVRKERAEFHARVADKVRHLLGSNNND